MRINPIKTAGIILIILFACGYSFAQNRSPVKIEFDPNSKRIDLKTGKEIPNYSLAKRGSIRFYLGRLDKPDDFVSFYHDGVRRALISLLRRMEKVQPQFAIWRLRYKAGNKNTPRIHHLAVSFVPLTTPDNSPQKRVFLLLNDLKLIDWGDK